MTQSSKPTQKKKVPPPTAQAKRSNDSMLERAGNWFQNRGTLFFVVSCLLTVLFSLLLFDVKISDTNDDSLYVETAWKITRDFKAMFYANAPLYSLFLVLPLKLFGLKIILLKSLNGIFILLQIVLLYFTFRNRVNSMMMFMALLTIAINPFMLFNASMTFNEPMFLCLQLCLIYFVGKMSDTFGEPLDVKQSWKVFLTVGFLAFLLSIVKNVAVLSIAAVIFFLLIERKFLHIVYVTVAFLLFRLPFQFLGSVLSGGSSQYSSQGAMIMQVDPYNPSKGMETFSGFVNRFFVNGNLYISKRFFQILGLKSIESTTTSGFLVFLCAVVFLVAVYILFRNKNKILVFAAIYLSLMMAGTFTALQTSWDQTRLILVYVPLILLIVYQGYTTFLIGKAPVLSVFFIAILFIVLGAGFFKTLDKATTNFPILKKNLGGDIYYGYTEDWINYLKMSEYCADSLPDSALVAVRKAPMSFMYAHGKLFYPVYSAFSTDADTVLNTFREAGVDYFVLASLRRNPKKIDGYIINTLHRMMYPVQQKYPQKITQVKQIGTNEPATLFKINY